MQSSLFAFLALAVLLLSPSTHAQTDILPSGCDAGTVIDTCLNLGNTTVDVGKYRADLGLIKYRKGPVFTTLPTTALNADEPNAYQTVVEKKVLRFVLRVPGNTQFDITLGLIDYQRCDIAEGNSIKITAGKNKVKVTVNPLLDEGGGCNTVVPVTLRGVQSKGSGKIAFKLKGTGVVSVGTVCVTRHVMTPLIDDCTATNSLCDTFTGCGNYAIINASSAVSSDISPCDVEESSFASLNIEEPDVFVRKAVLQWAGSGFPSGDSTDVFLNGQSVTSTSLRKNGDFEPYYTAIADSDVVTGIVRQFGTVAADYAVANIFHRKFHSCPQAHIAAWSLTVLYEKIGLPTARVNICTKNQESNRQIFDFDVGCIVPWSPVPDGGEARLTLVGVESDSFIERTRVNGLNLGDNNGFHEFNETSGEGFDVLTYDVAPLIKDFDKLTVSFKPDDTSHDVITLAVMNSYQTMNDAA